MSLLWADFPSGQTGLYRTTTANMLNGLYAEVSATLIEDPDLGTTGNVTLYSGTSTSILRKVLPASLSTIGFGFRIWMPSLPTSSPVGVPRLIQYRNTSNQDLLTITVETDGRISAYRGGTLGTLLGTSTSPALVANAWQSVEIKSFLDAASGTVEIRVEGIEVLNLTGQNTLGGTGPCTQIVQGKSGSNPAVNPFYAKDWVVWDTAGSINNDFFGSVSVYSLLTDGDVSLNWTPSTGTTGWDLLNESPPDDADYISADDAPPAAAVMSLTNLPADVTSVRGLIAIARSMKTDGGDGNLQVSMVSNGTPGNGSDRPITTAFTYWFDVFETDPDTSAAWTPVAVDAANIQFDRTV